MIKKLCFALSALLILNGCQCGNPVLTIEGGKVKGVVSGTPGIVVYKGIPYAAAPVGENRWRAPQPVEAWEGVRKADSFGNAAWQATHREGEFYYKEFFDEGDAPFSEDCLTLNVWTPAAGKTDAKLPVAMWVHGGAYTGGWGFEKEMDGEAWAERGVILVTINYRLGIFGFLAHPLLAEESENSVAGNYGILDQIAALKWIRDNISQFGGDPDNITIFGQSAGGGSIKTLVASPLTAGMVSHAIIQSAGGLDKPGGIGIGENNYKQALALGKDLMDFGGYTTLEEMRAAPAEDIFALSSKYSAEKRAWMMFGPVIDGYVSTSTFSEAVYDGKIADVPYMIGCVNGDLRMGSLGSLEAIANFCLSREKDGSRGYAYKFARPLPGDDAGAYHSSELWYIFGTQDRAWRPFTAGDKALSGTMLDAWTNFAKTGNPNAPDSAEWPAYTTASPQFMVFDVASDDTASATPQQLL